MAAIDWAASLAKCVAPLAGEGFPVATWNTDAVARSYITTPKFIKAVNILTREADELVLLRLIHLGSAGDWWSAPATCTPAQMYKFCIWLQSPKGAAEMRRLGKKAFAGQNVDDVRYLYAMEAQLSAHSAAVRAARVRFMREKEVIRAEHLPASAYVPLDEMEMGEKCYKLYEGECARRGKVADVVSDEVLRYVEAVYGEEAVARHKAEFMRDEKRREEVKVWLEGKMSGDAVQAKKYRFHLNLTAAGVASPPTEERAKGKENGGEEGKEGNKENGEEEDEDEDEDEDEEEEDEEERAKEKAKDNVKEKEKKEEQYNYYSDTTDSDDSI